MKHILLFGLSAVVLTAAESGEWSFEKISRYDRAAEPVSIGMPFPRGLLRAAAQFSLRDAGRVVPSQATVTGRWPDGSIRWLWVRALVDLPGNRSRQITWHVGDAVPAAAPGVHVTRNPDGSLAVNTGPLAMKMPAAGFFPFTDVSLNGRPVGAGAWMQGFRIADWSSANAGPVKLEVLEQGPVAAVIGIKGNHGGPFDFSALLTFWAGKPYVSLEYTVIAARSREDTLVPSWEWRGTPGSGGLARISRGHYGASRQEDRKPLSYRFGLEQFRFDAVEHAFQSYWGDFWCGWTGAESGVAVTLRQAQQNFPKAMEASPDGLAILLYPREKEPLAFPAGAAKTHEMLFHFHPAGDTSQNLSVRSLQFQTPDVPKIESAWFARAKVWDDRVLEGPRSRRMEAALYDILDNRAVGMGIWNFGDEVEWGYTGQGRGKDEVVWLNNEYDFAHSCFLAWARAGERRFLDYGRVNSLHWRDVDIARVSTDPNRRQGHITHSARHVTGGVSPSHQWVEGLFDAYHILGDRAALEAALGIGENILRTLPRYDKPGASSTRDTGWALRALLALYRETGDPKYLEPCHRIAALFQKWHKEYPGLLSPYTEHSLVRVGFMNSLTLVSLARYHQYFPDEALKRMILDETDELIRNTRNTNGLFFYKELPSLKHQGATPLILQALGYAYLLSGDRRYIEAGLTEFEYQFVNGNLRFMIHTGAAEKFGSSGGGYSRPLVYTQGGKFVGVSFMPMLEYLSLSGSAELARQVDFQLRLP